MIKSKLSKYFALGLTGLLLAGCADTNDNNYVNSPEEAESGNDSVNEDATDTSTGEGNEESSEETDESDSQTASGINKLEMNSEDILLPTIFPGKEESAVSHNILTNEADQYAAEFLEDGNQSFVQVTGTAFENAELASKELAAFTEGKTVGKIEENSTDLGYGITGYAEGAAGTQYFGWSEGNWQFLIESVSEDQMNNPNIAEQMVEFLEEHYLPAPDDWGMIYIDYPAGGEEVNIDIRWQDQEIVYQLTTSEVPLDALEMTASME